MHGCHDGDCTDRTTSIHVRLQFHTREQASLLTTMRVHLVQPTCVLTLISKTYSQYPTVKLFESLAELSADVGIASESSLSRISSNYP